MKGDKQVIERLNEALFLELGAVNQYWVHFRLLEDWGYTKLARKERAESIEEMRSRFTSGTCRKICFTREPSFGAPGNPVP